MSHPAQRLPHDDFTVACICPMGFELAAMEAMLDETYESLSSTRDHNVYSTGRIGPHNVVIAVMPRTGNNRAAAVATQLMNDFRSIRFGLLVGIGGGIPGKKQDDIRLGDVVVSKPTSTFGGVVQYDMGKAKAGTPFERNGSLNSPPTLLMVSVQRLDAQHTREGSQIPKYLREMLDRYPRMVEKKFVYQGTENDNLFPATYVHHKGESCDKCDFTQTLIRPDRISNDPEVHYGTIGSANAVIKDGILRDHLRKEMGLLCVEMEAAGLMEDFPCLVIRGISDYADSHKNDRWKPYAAATPAAYAKELLMSIPQQDLRTLRLIDVASMHQVSEILSDTNKQLKNLSKAHQLEHGSKVMDWLASTDFWSKQLDFRERAQQGTGQWIFEDSIFKSWVSGQKRILWCEGLPGAGKTVLSAIIIEHLRERLDMNQVGLAWIYVDYREHDLQTMENLFASLLLQLFRQRGEISESVTKYLGYNWEKEKPSLSEYISWFKEEVQKFDQTIVVIDALDEMRTSDLCKHFIRELKDIQPPLQLLVTSRPYVQLKSLLGIELKIEVRPRQDDVIRYIESRLKTSERLRDLVKDDSSLHKTIIELLTTANDTMFLKAELILNVLEQLRTAKEVKEALHSLPSTYHDCYEFSLKQIEMQGTSQRDKAFKVLAFLAFAKRPLTVTGLQQALSVQLGDLELDDSKQITTDDLVSVCRGLVVIESMEGTQNIRLLHETTRSYLKTIQYANFPPGNEIIFKACLAYLSLREFCKMCRSQSAVNERNRQYPFFGYAARYWSEHAIQGNFESIFGDEIIQFLESSQRYSADESMATHRRSGWGADFGSAWTCWNRNSIDRLDSPLHAASTSGLSKTIHYFLQEKLYDVNQRNNFGETPLHRAAQVGQTAAMAVLRSDDADLYAKVNHHYLTEATPLILAVLCCQVDAVRFLINRGVDVNAFDPKYGTFPLHLAASMDTELTQLLLDHRASVNFAAKSPVYPETYPMTSLLFAVFFANRHEGAAERVRCLLQRGADINFRSSLGNTALHMAISGAHRDVTSLLLDKGADMRILNKKGKSAVRLARELGRFEWIVQYAPLDVLERQQLAPAIFKAIWSKNHSLVRELLDSGHALDQEDEFGNTPWDYCVLSSDIELARILVQHMRTKQLPKSNGETAFTAAIAHMTAFDYTDQNTWEDTVRICTLLHPDWSGDLGFAHARSNTCGPYNKTYLILAAEQGRLSMVKFLLECGSDVNAVDVFGCTGLQYAVGNKNMPMVELLVDHGADLTLKANDGSTVLHSAEMSGSVLINKYLALALGKQLGQIR